MKSIPPQSLILLISKKNPKEKFVGFYYYTEKGLIYFSMGVENNMSMGIKKREYKVKIIG